MANQLDLEEQEQLDQLKHSWNRYGNLITGLLLAVLLGVAAWNGYHYWQRSQATQAAAMFDEMSKSVAAGDTARAQRTFSDMKERYGAASYTHQAGLALAKLSMDKGELDVAKTALQWVADKSGDEGYVAIARLRLAAIYFDAKDYVQALAVLDSVKAEGFAALVLDRRGDVFMMQDKRSQALSAYSLAYQKLDERSQYRRVVLVKLNALGAEPDAAVKAKLTQEVK
jgi:predicted negative regulator of RcsB-dependent stress response